MAIIINTNTQSLFAQRALGNNTMSLQRSIEKLSTGYKINRAGDDAAGLSISEKMTAQLRGIDKAKQNIGDGISVIQTAEGALGIVQENLQRIRELVVQGLNGTNSSKEADALQKEINERVNTIDAIATSTKFNGIDLIKGASDIVLQTGAEDGQQTTITLGSGVSTGVGIDIDVAYTAQNGTTDYGTLVEGITDTSFALDRLHLGVTGMTENAVAGSSYNVTANLDDIDTVIDNISRMRSYLGAMQNRLESQDEYLSVASENTGAARSRVRDVDVARESSIMLKNQILQQSAATMLSQANATPQLALNLLP